MQSLSDQDRYRIISERDMRYAGQFFVGVKSTGIFCRPGCPARTPKPENCEYFADAKAAMAAHYRACKRCHPMRLPNETPSIVRHLLTAVEADPEQRWQERDIKAMGIDPSTARRQFQKRFGMTFTQFARARRLGAALTDISKGHTVIDAQLTAGYASPSGFRKAFSERFGQAPQKSVGLSALMIDWLDTPLGPMIAICDDRHLYLLEFTVRKNIDRQVTRLQKTYGRAIVPGRTDITAQIETELKAYFEGTLTVFKTPTKPTGTAFQNQVWAQLQTIPYAQTWSYTDLATHVDNPKGVRAVASSNASNGMAIIIPCHRVISKGGGLGGYAGGLDRKIWLLEHERRHAGDT